MSSFASRAQLLAGGIAAAFTIVSAAPQIASPPESNFTSWVHKQSRTNRRYRYKAISSGPGSGQDVLKRTAIAVASQTILRPQRCWMLAAEEDQNDGCKDEMNALVEFLTMEPAICPTP